MRGLLKFAWLPILALPVVAAPFTVNTGSASWTVSQTNGTSNNGSTNGTVSNALILTGVLPSAWAAELDGGQWVGQQITDGNYIDPILGTCGSAAPTSTCGANPGTYVYQLVLGGVSSLGGSFNFSFSSDNNVSIVIAGLAGGSQTFTNPGLSAPVTNTGTLTWAAGSTVTITATVTNDPFTDGGGNPLPNRNPSGFLAYGAGNTVDNTGIPEPSTYAMIALGGAGLLVARLRRK